MYNEDRKNQFITRYTKSLHTAKQACKIFRALKPYEEKYDCDVCAMSVQELQTAVDGILTGRSSQISWYVTILREYIKWCTANKIPGACDSIRHIDITAIEQFKSHMVASPLHLQQYLDAVFPSISEETFELTLRCFVWLAYFGIPEAEALTVTNTQIDFDNLEIHLGHKDIKLYPEALPTFRKAVQLTDFAYYHPNYGTIRRNRADGDIVTRGFRSKPQVMAFRAMLSSRFAEAVKAEKTDMQLSYQRIKLSGLFYRTYELERAGFGVDFSEAALEKILNSPKQSDVKERLQERKKRSENNFMSDYLRWKLAFAT